MRKQLVCAALLLGSCVGAAVAQSDFIDGAALLDAGFVKYWQLPLPLHPGQELGFCYLVDNQIYAATKDGYVYAVDAQTGAIRWVKQVTTAGYEIRRPCHVGNLVLFVFPPSLVMYDRYSGQPIKKIETRFPTGSAPISDGTRFYVGGIDQKLYSFVPAYDFEVWKARADGQILSRPALNNEYLFFADGVGSLFACKAENKEFVWKTRRLGAVTADLAVDENGVYVASQDYSLYLLDPKYGGLRWRMRFSGPLTEPPVLTPKVAYQFCYQDGLVAVNAETVGVKERVRWTLPAGRSLLTIDGNNAYVLSRDLRILEVDVETGQISHEVPADGFEFFMPTTKTVALLLGSSDGRLFCARKQGVPIVLAEEVKQALRTPGETAAPAETKTDTGQQGESQSDDALTTKRPGPPLGGKSKVTKEFERGQSGNKPRNPDQPK
jgi:outer membrane protein assembly factor BamB